MSFLFNLNTKVHTETETKPVMNAINILKRDMVKVFGASDENGNDIHLKKDDTLDEGSYKIDIAEKYRDKCGGRFGVCVCTFENK